MTDRETPTVPTEQRAQTRLAWARMLVPIFFAVAFAACIIGVVPQAASERHQGRRRRAGGADGAAARRPRRRRPARRSTSARWRRSPSDARRPRPRPQRGVRAHRGPEAARDRDRRERRRPHRRDGGRDARPRRHDGPGRAARRARCPPAGRRGRDRARRLHVHDRLHDLRLPRRRRSSRRSRPRWGPSRRYAMIAAIAVLVPTLVYLIGGLGYGTYNGSFGTILAFIGVGALYTFVDRPGDPPAAGGARSAGDLRVARDLRVPQHREPRRHLHRPGAGALLALPQPLLDRCGDRRTPSAASCTSAGWTSAPTCSGSSPGRR